MWVGLRTPVRSKVHTCNQSTWTRSIFRSFSIGKNLYMFSSNFSNYFVVVYNFKGKVEAE